MSNRLALIIGNSLYNDPTLSKLNSPDADVGALKDTLLDPELGGFDDVNLVFNSAYHIVRREIFNFFARKKREDLLLLYFSGHGVLDENGRLYLAIKNTDTQALRATAIPARDIAEEMDNSRSKRQVLLLDCCHSGAFERGSKGRTGATVGTASAFEGSGYGRVVLTASDATQYAWEGDKIIGEAENSLFTHFIIQGIKTGDADTNKDGKISIDEIFDYAYSHILDKTPKQTPGKWSFKEQGELIISQAPPKVIPFEHFQPGTSIEEKQENQIQRLYTDGLGGFWLEDWDKAIKNFEAILAINPENQDVESKLEQARSQKRYDGLYQMAIKKFEEGDLAKSIGYFEDLLGQTKDYKDANEIFLKVKRQKELLDLYSEARQLSNSRNYQAVINIFNRLQELSPDYQDPEGLLQKAEVEVAKIDQAKKLEQLYSQAILDVNAGKHLEARTALSRIQEIDKEYRDTAAFLEKLDRLIEKTDIPKVTQQDITQQDIKEEKKPHKRDAVDQIVTEEKPIETKENFIGWLKSSIKEPKWRFKKREIIASIIGVIIMFGGGFISVFSQDLIIPVFFGIIFGPMVGLISGFLGNLSRIILYGGFYPGILVVLARGLSLGIFGLMMGLIYPSINFSSIRKFIYFEVYYFFNLILYFLMSIIFELPISYIYGYSFFAYFSFGNVLITLLIAGALGLILLPILFMAYKKISNLRKK